MAVKSLRLLDAGAFYSYAGRFALTLDMNKRIKVPVWMGLIESDDGWVVVDTGMDPAGLDDPAAVHGHKFSLIDGTKGEEWKAEFRPENDVRKQLRKVGLSTGDIRFVINTHFHFDHCGANRFFTSSEIVAHKLDWGWALNPDPFFAKAFVPEQFNHPLKYRFIDGDMVLIPGVTIIHTPGHTPGTLSVVVDLPRTGTVILAGDTVHCRENFEKRVPTGSDNCYSAIDCLRSYDKMRAILDRSARGFLLPGHDENMWDVISREPYL